MSPTHSLKTFRLRPLKRNEKWGWLQCRPAELQRSDSQWNIKSDYLIWFYIALTRPVTFYPLKLNKCGIKETRFKTDYVMQCNLQECRASLKTHLSMLRPHKNTDINWLKCRISVLCQYYCALIVFPVNFLCVLLVKSSYYLLISRTLQRLKLPYVYSLLICTHPQFTCPSHTPLTLQ